MFQQVLNDLESFVSKIKAKPIEQFENEIQTAILLTGDLFEYISKIHFYSDKQNFEITVL